MLRTEDGMENLDQARPWTDERVCLGGADFFDALIGDIEAAEESLDLETFIFLDDETGLRVAERIEAAVRRGVAVRLMVDGFGSYTFPFDLQPRLERAGATIRVYHPLPGHAVHRDGVAALSKLGDKLARANRRNHRKLAVIDHRVAWTGSRNISNDHAERGGDAWRDTSVRLEGPAVRDLERSFEYVWQGRPRRSEEQLQPSRYASGQGEVRAVWLNSTATMRHRTRRELRRRIRSAQRRVWLATAYFAPPPSVLHSLRHAAESGADVRIVVPRQSDQQLLPWLAASYYRDLLRRGVRIFEFPEHTILHAKDLVIDDSCIVGSVNFNHRSFRHDLELEVSLFERESIDAVAGQLEDDMAASSEIGLESFDSSLRVRELVGTMLRPLRRFM